LGRGFATSGFGESGWASLCITEYRRTTMEHTVSTEADGGMIDGGHEAKKPLRKY
jgi:hypothetical protein